MPVGRSVGMPVGRSVGMSVGMPVGRSVGICWSLGRPVGSVGRYDGRFVVW